MTPLLQRKRRHPERSEGSRIGSLSIRENLSNANFIGEVPHPPQADSG
jgi:hypothetical protein